MAVFLIGLPILAGWFLYQNRSIFSPLNDFAEALQLWEGKSKAERKFVNGEVTQISENYTIRMKDENGDIFNFRLTALEAPSVRQTSFERVSSLLSAAQEKLSELILSNHVQVAVTHLDADQNGLGVIYWGKTNVNALIVELGLAQLRREYFRDLKLSELYALLRAERAAREAK